LNLSSSDVADLEERAEGWIAGLQLAALSLQGRDSPSTLIQAFNGQHHFVLEYLVEDVVRRQPEHIRRFLERTSILDRLYGPLCEAVSGQPDGASLLAQLWHNNLFTEPLDEAGQWFRQHHLLAEVLFDQLQHTQPEIIPELHRRARDWYAEHGYLHEAMRHALAGGQFEWVADCLERCYRPFVFRGELATLRQWLEAIPIEIVRARPKLSVIYAWGSAYTGRLDAIEGYLQQAEDAAANLPPAEQQALHGEVVSLRAVVQSVGGDAQRAVELAHKAMGLAPKEDAFLQMVAQHALGNSYRLLGRAIEAESALLEAQRLCQPLGGLVLDTAVRIRLGQAQVMRGRLRQAMQSFEAALKPGSASELLPNVCEVYVRMGDVYREWNDLDTALQYIQKGVDMAQRTGNALALLNGYFTLMRVQFARGETAAPHETLSRAEQVASCYDYPHTAERLAAHQTWLNLALGDFDTAARWADEYAAARSRLDGRSGQMADLQDTLLARIRLWQGRIDEAEHLLAEILREAEAAGRGWTALQVRLLRSLTLQARGQSIQAMEEFEHALALAEPEGYVRLFVDEGQPVRLLLQRMSASREGGGMKAYVRRLLDAFGTEQAPLHPSSFTPPPSSLIPHPLIEPLSARELEVLRLLAEGRSNQAIAEVLFISVGTVKSHTNHILGKLNANNRTEAVAHARALGLL
jgi:LuxR family maltose regulon positive regulatory protein